MNKEKTSPIVFIIPSSVQSKMGYIRRPPHKTNNDQQNENFEIEEILLKNIFTE